MNRLLRHVGRLLLLLLLSPQTAFACEHCFGASVDTLTTRGIALAMAALLGFTGLVATGVVAFFRKISLRAKALEAGDLAVTEYGRLVDNGSATDAN